MKNKKIEFAVIWLILSVLLLGITGGPKRLLLPDTKMPLALAR